MQPAWPSNTAIALERLKFQYKEVSLFLSIVQVYRHPFITAFPLLYYTTVESSNISIMENMSFIMENISSIMENMSSIMMNISSEWVSIDELNNRSDYSINLNNNGIQEIRFSVRNGIMYIVANFI